MDGEGQAPELVVVAARGVSEAEVAARRIRVLLLVDLAEQAAQVGHPETPLLHRQLEAGHHLLLHARRQGDAGGVGDAPALQLLQQGLPHPRLVDVQPLEPEPLLGPGEEPDDLGVGRPPRELVQVDEVEPLPGLPEDRQDAVVLKLPQVGSPVVRALGRLDLEAGQELELGVHAAPDEVLGEEAGGELGELREPLHPEGLLRELPPLLLQQLPRDEGRVLGADVEDGVLRVVEGPVEDVVPPPGGAEEDDAAVGGAQHREQNPQYDLLGHEGGLVADDEVGRVPPDPVLAAGQGDDPRAVLQLYAYLGPRLDPAHGDGARLQELGGHPEQVPALPQARGHDQDAGPLVHEGAVDDLDGRRLRLPRLTPPAADDPLRGRVHVLALIREQRPVEEALGERGRIIPETADALPHAVARRARVGPEAPEEA